MAETTSKATNPGKGQPKKGATQKKESKKGSNIFAVLMVPICVILAFLFFYFVLGNPNNFEGGVNSGTDIQAKNILGTIYTGGIVVPFLISLLLIVITFVIERFFTIAKAKGKISNTQFLRTVQYNLANKEIDKALAQCDKQKGSLGNVMRSGLEKYKEMTTNTDLSTEQKIINIQSEIDEATTLELPILEKNLVFLSTISSCATLLGLFGTVVGMIKAFNALGDTGGSNSTQLALGIAEALVNTATGILTSFIAIIFYNYFTTNIDGITYGIDETGYTLTQNFAALYE